MLPLFKPFRALSFNRMKAQMYKTVSKCSDRLGCFCPSYSKRLQCKAEGVDVGA